MWTLLMTVLLACTCATDTPPPPVPVEPVPATVPAPKKGTKLGTMKPLPDGVAVIMVHHPDYKGSVLFLDGEEIGSTPVKAVTTPGLHNMVLKVDGEAVFEREVPVVQRRGGVLLLDLSK